MFSKSQTFLKTVVNKTRETLREKKVKERKRKRLNLFASEPYRRPYDPWKMKIALIIFFKAIFPNHFFKAMKMRVRWKKRI